MMGRRILDPGGVESAPGAEVPGLGWLDVETSFAATKTTRQRRGTAMGQRVTGYEIHHGQVTAGARAPGWVHLDDSHGTTDEGAIEPDEARFLGTTLHGLFEQDAFRATFLTEIGRRRDRTFVPAGVGFAEARNTQLDRLADLLEANIDLDRLAAIVSQGAPR
jgi:adenosylcobyric acid synthase